MKLFKTVDFLARFFKISSASWFSAPETLEMHMSIYFWGFGTIVEKILNLKKNYLKKAKNWI